MQRRALATKILAALALLMPPAVRAQLPDAPSAVLARLRSLAPQPLEMDVSRREGSAWSAGMQGVSSGATATYSIKILNSEDSVARRKSTLLAMNMAAIASGQQSLYKPQKERVSSGLTSSIAETRPIPGAGPVLEDACTNDFCSLAESNLCCGNARSPFARYLKKREAVPLTARDNLESAAKNIIDPFNLLTIAGDSAIGVASNSHSVYGPGFRGFSKYAGVSLTEDITGEFFGTFLVPSIMHQDPHYYREPYVSLKRRILHAITQVVWTQSYTGRPMFNYANIFGGIATAAVSNTFAPGPGRQDFSKNATNLAIAFATSPSGNLIEEFFPDFASRINLRVVIFQRILNSVSLQEAGGIQ